MTENYVARSNIKRFELLLTMERDPARRAMLSVLLADERRKVAQSLRERDARPGK